MGKSILDIVLRWEPTTPVQVSVDAELLLLAHACFVTSLDADGLRRCASWRLPPFTVFRLRIIFRKRVPVCVSTGCFDTLGRLWCGLPGVGPLNDVLHLLKKHDRFEVVLRKDGEKDGMLASCHVLSTFLQRYYPDDNDYQQMVPPGLGGDPC